MIKSLFIVNKKKKMYKWITIVGVILLILGLLLHYIPIVTDANLEEPDRSVFMGANSKFTVAGKISILGLVFMCASIFVITFGAVGIWNERESQTKQRMTTKTGVLSTVIGCLGLIILLNIPLLSVILGLIAILLGYVSFNNGDNTYGIGGLIIGSVNLIIFIFLFLFLH